MDVILCDYLTPDQLNTYRLVLEAYSWAYRIKKTEWGGQIWVDASIYPKALALITQYDAENPKDPPEEIGHTQPNRTTYSATWVVLLLAVVHGIISMADRTDRMVSLYSASAVQIMSGQLYRSATALMVHADLGHLAGNAVGLALLGTLVCNITGAGVGWLIILLSGIVGNLANAALFQYGHVSIGASTAVFGALGFLAGHRYGRQKIAANKRSRAWLPLAGGLALLAFLGTSAQADLTAHLFGFIAGLCFGLGYVRAVDSSIHKKANQIGCMVIASMLLATSWLWPLVDLGGS